jgi:hypothetical protein
MKSQMLKRYKCHDCGAMEGEIHELGCDMERCPFCAGQLICCDCGAGQDKFEDDWEGWERMLNAKGRVPFILYPNMRARFGKLWPEMFSVQIRNGSGTSKKANAIKYSANHAMIK